MSSSDLSCLWSSSDSPLPCTFIAWDANSLRKHVRECHLALVFDQRQTVQCGWNGCVQVYTGQTAMTRWTTHMGNAHLSALSSNVSATHLNTSFNLPVIPPSSNSCSVISQTSKNLHCVFSGDCNELFDDLDTLVAHIRVDHQAVFQSSSQVECAWDNTCSSRFHNVEYLIDHVLFDHLGICRHQCSCCHPREFFKRKSQLEKHERITLSIIPPTIPSPSTSKINAKSATPLNKPPAASRLRARKGKNPQTIHAIKAYVPMPNQWAPAETQEKDSIYPTPVARGYYSTR
ncbi:uncharacterized protein JCM6883_007504 [Sporobolomyces salmoneus]|uniref:uncharacterized protein n=1 Tax=Sporobolomyces salmoneus TaxID=183962 RepID=UPI003175EE13